MKDFPFFFFSFLCSHEFLNVFSMRSSFALGKEGRKDIQKSTIVTTGKRSFTEIYSAKPSIVFIIFKRATNGLENERKNEKQYLALLPK